MKFELPDSVKLAQLPTPIEKLERLSRRLEGPEIYIKRDDFTGLELSGNKVRKLEFLLAEALNQQCDSVITCGGNQSNHARTTAIACARLGLSTHLVLRDGMTKPLEGNLFLGRLVGAEIESVTSDEYLRVDEIMQAAADKLKSAGHTPFIIPEGGSNDIGALGYVRAAEEISKQLRESKLRIDHIVVPVGSGGTHAGLLFGKFIYDLPAQIHGINVCDDKAYFMGRISKILQKMEQRFKLNLQLDPQEINIIDGYVGKGYGLSSQEEIDLLKDIARMEGVILDPVYTSKAMLGLVDQIRKGAFKEGENILFIHTGGIFGLFPKKSLFF